MRFGGFFTIFTMALTFYEQKVYGTTMTSEAFNTAGRNVRRVPFEKRGYAQMSHGFFAQLIPKKEAELLMGVVCSQGMLES